MMTKKRKRGRRGRHEGSIVWRPQDERWEGRVDLGRGPDGRRRRKSVFAKTREACSAKVNKLLGRAEDGTLFTTSTPTVKAWLTTWYDTNVSNWRPSTQRVYKHVIETRLIPAFGVMRLEQLQPLAVQRWINAQTAAHGARVVTWLAAVVLRKALRDAMRAQLVVYNAAALVMVPKPESRTVTPFSVEDSQALLVAAHGHYLEAAIYVAIMLGLRQGEICGLRWSDLDLDAGVLNVRQQTQRVKRTGEPQAGQTRTVIQAQPLKTKHSRRTLELPSGCAAALRDHRRRQLETRMKLGQAWQDHGYVFPREDGTARDPRSLADVLWLLCDKAKVARRRFHTLRHTTACLLLADGEDLFGVSRVLGHSKINTTADIYGHLVPAHATRVAQRMDSILPAASEREGVSLGVNAAPPPTPKLQKARIS